MAYQVLARGWRPQKFEDVIGQQAVVMTLKNALVGDTLGHAYLFSGLRGVGKTTAARLLAKAVNCSSGPTPEPCGECAACTEIAEGSCIDVVEVDGASNRKIEDVRELRELLRYRPTRDRFRVIIIDEVHMLTREAFNALLKSLEEPPPYIIFILATTERQKVPTTILSRCQQLEFRAVGAALIAERLRLIAEGEGFALSRPASEAIARAAQGSVRDALSLLDQLRAFSQDQIDEEAVAEVLGVPRFEMVVNLVDLLATGKVAEALSLLREELVSGHDPAVLFQETGRALRLALHLSIDAGLEPGLTDEQRDFVMAMASRLGSGALGRMLGLWLEQEPLVRDAGNRELALEVACLRLSRWPAVQRVEAFLAGENPPAPAAASGGGGTRVTESSSGAVGARESAPRQAVPKEAEAPPAPEPEEEEPTTPGGLIARELWEAKEVELAGAVDSAEVSVQGETAVLVFAGKAAPLARVADSADGRSRLEVVCRKVLPDVTKLQVEVVDDGSSLENVVADDEQVAMVQRIIGGDVVSVLPDGTPTSD